jgi:hypothetical protein
MMMRTPTIARPYVMLTGWGHTVTTVEVSVGSIDLNLVDVDTGGIVYITPLGANCSNHDHSGPLDRAKAWAKRHGIVIRGQA